MKKIIIALLLGLMLSAGSAQTVLAQTDSSGSGDQTQTGSDQGGDSSEPEGGTPAPAEPIPN